jgi:cytochrome c553
MLNRVIVSCTLLMMSGIAAADTADTDAGKAKVQAICSKCHETGDWKGQSAAQIQAKIQNVVAGKTKHPKKLDLTDADIANVAAYWATAAN